MPTPLERIAEAVVEAVPNVLDGVEAGSPTILPRGADPFAGAERPLLLDAIRWAAVSPGGVIFGGSAEAVAAVLGFELPERPAVSGDAAAQQRRSTDQEDGEGEDGDATPEPEPEPEADAGDSPEAGADGEGQEGDAPAEAPVPARRWSDHVADASRDAAAAAGDGLIRALAVLVGLPPGATAPQAVLAESDAMVSAAVGPLPDAVIVPLRRGDAEIRVIVVVAGIVAARVSAAAVQVGSASGPGAAPVEDAEIDDAPPPEPLDLPRVSVGAVPLELCAEIGTTRLPLSSVLALREGAVVELSEAVDAPIQLVAGATPVAAGELELDDAGGLVLHVTSIPGRPDLTAGPTLVDVPAAESGGAEADAIAVPGAPEGDEAPLAAQEPSEAPPGVDG